MITDINLIREIEEAVKTAQTKAKVDGTPFGISDVLKIHEEMKEKYEASRRPPVPPFMRGNPASDETSSDERPAV